MRLEDACELIVDCPHTTAPDEGQGYPLVRTPNIGLGRLVFDNMHRVSESVYKQRNKRATPRAGDLIYAREAMPGNVALLLPGQEVCLGQRTVLIRPNNEIVESAYLTYLLLSNECRNKLVGTANGATVLHVNIPAIRNFDITLPPLPTQRKIAKVLSAYDDLIENNTKRIRILERMAEELYKEWFVRFRFPGHEKAKFVNGLPEGWRESRCGEVIDFDPMTRVDRGCQLTMVPMAALSTKMMSLDASQFAIVENASGSKFRNGDTLLAKITPCLENGKTAYVYGLDEGEVAVGSTEFVVMRGREIGPRLCYCIARSDWFRAIAIGSMSGADGRQRVKVEKLRQAVISLPSNELLEKFESVLSPMFNEVEKLTRQNALLARQRDLLLPRLMSGKLSVEGVG